MIFKKVKTKNGMEFFLFESAFETLRIVRSDILLYVVIITE